MFVFILYVGYSLITETVLTGGILEVVLLEVMHGDPGQSVLETIFQR